MGRQDDRDHRTVTLYDDDALQLMQGWWSGQGDPLYAIHSMGGQHEAWVFQDAISNLDSDIAKVKLLPGRKGAKGRRIGPPTYQLGKGTFKKDEINELHIIRDALQAALDEAGPAAAEAGVSEARRKSPEPLPDDLRAVIGTVAHNKEFTITDIVQYARRRHPDIAEHADALVRRMVKDGLLYRAARGVYFPTREGWDWIERIAPHRGLGTREATRHVADFSTLPEIVAHAQKDGATHVSHGLRWGKLAKRGEAAIYFPRQDGKYDEAQVWHEAGYWHSHAPSDRKVVSLPSDAYPISYLRRRTTWTLSSWGHTVRDYIAVDGKGLTVGGPFKDYGEAKRRADKAGGHVEFKMGEAARGGSGAGKASPRHGRKTEPGTPHVGAEVEFVATDGSHSYGHVVGYDGGYAMVQWHQGGYPDFVTGVTPSKLRVIPPGHGGPYPRRAHESRQQPHAGKASRQPAQAYPQMPSYPPPRALPAPARAPLALPPSPVRHARRAPPRDPAARRHLPRRRP